MLCRLIAWRRTKKELGLQEGKKYHVRNPTGGEEKVLTYTGSDEDETRHNFTDDKKIYYVVYASRIRGSAE
jgi:hypothetical protein